MKKPAGPSLQLLARDFARVGRVLSAAGLNNSHSGNLSVRSGERLIITRHGAMLGDLKRRDLVSVRLVGDDAALSVASMEAGVHRAVYRSTSAAAVVHTHPRTAIALSFGQDEIVPIDVEGGFHLGKVPVLAAAKPTASKELESALPILLAKFPAAIVRGHGAFAVGANLDEAMQISSTLEWSCQILLRARLLGMGTGRGQRREGR